MDIGGGFPIPETGVHYNLTAILDQIAARLQEDFPIRSFGVNPAAI